MISCTFQITHKQGDRGREYQRTCKVYIYIYWRWQELTTCLWHCYQKREKLPKLIITNNLEGEVPWKRRSYRSYTNWLEEEVTDHYKREKLLKERRSHIKEGEGTSKGTKREIFLFGIVLLFWPSPIEFFWLGWSIWFAINAKEGDCWHLIETSLFVY